MSLTDLSKTIANVAVNLIRVPLALIERAIPGRGGAERAADPVAAPPEPPKPAAKRKPATTAKRKPAAKKPAAKKPSAAKKPATAKKPARPAAAQSKPAKPDAASAARTTPAEERGVVDESTDGLEAATDRAVAAREDLEQSASRDR